MLSLSHQILQYADSPADLERLYRERPADFTAALPGACAAHPESLVLQAWQARLAAMPGSASGVQQAAGARWQARELWVVAGLTLVAGTAARLPQYLTLLDPEAYYVRNLGGIIAAVLIAHLCLLRASPVRVALTLLAGVAVAVFILHLLPIDWANQGVVMAFLHLPVVLWLLVGVAYAGGDWRSSMQRLAFVRYNGELLIHVALIALGGMVLTALTLGLFDLLDVYLEDWYFETVIPYCAIGALLVGTLLIERIIGPRFKIAPLIARLFTPFFLVLVVAYLATMAVQGASPFHERDFLIAFNGLLLVVLGLSVLSIAERGPRAEAGMGDWINIALVAVTLIIDLVALSAIIYRLGSFGFTPNRIAVLGANLIIFGHLAGILWHYLRFARRPDTTRPLEQWIGSYLPVYGGWGLVVALGLPWL
jgi:hypothetical protein